MPKNNDPQYIIVHHTATPRDKTTFAAVDRYHRKKWNFRSAFGHYIGYHYFIDAHGNIIHGRDNNEAGAHTRQKGMNYKSIGVCLAGNFDKEQPSANQIGQLAELLWQVSTTYNIPPERVLPHREFAAKSCYGMNLNDSWAGDLLRAKTGQKTLQAAAKAKGFDANIGELVGLLETTLHIARALKNNN